ncbi:hypothetical protein [Nocardia sp. NBC_00511]|uniref:hypothetical protein n=1 Tax=Nocardia sp. NBC_00511 TaxID=2903591 RepID=UPI0030E1E182
MTKNMTERLASPQVTGGGGFDFEHHVATILLSRMLRGAHFPVGVELPIARVELQQRNSGCTFDDIVVVCVGEDPAPSLQIQVKTTLDAQAIEAVGRAACESYREHPGEMDYGTLQLGGAATEPAGVLRALARLVAMARAHARSESYQASFRPNITNAWVRGRGCCRIG